MVKPVMLKTATSHAFVAVAVQAAVAPWLGWIAGGVAGVMFYLGREIAQHEYKGGSWEKDLPPWYGLVHHWGLDSVLDLFAPAVAVSAVAGTVHYLT